MTARYLEPGTVRTFTCRRCGDVYRETWVERRPAGYRVSGRDAEGRALPDETVRGCPAVQLGWAAAHIFSVETDAPTEAAS